MSTELAKANQGKLSLALLAIVAILAFAAFAVFNGRDNASADVNGGDYLVTGPFQDDLSTPVSAIGIGGEAHYLLEGTLSAPTAGELQIDFAVPAELNIVSVTPETGPAPVCAIADDGLSFTCTYPANMAADTAFSLDIEVTGVAAGDVLLPDLTCTADDISNQAAQACAVETGELEVIEVTLDKSASPTTIPGAGGEVVYTLNFGPLDTAAPLFLDITFEDTFGNLPDDAVITGVNQTSGSASFSCFDASNFPVLVGDTVGDIGTVTCTASNVDTSIATTVEITIDFPADPDGGTFTNEATLCGNPDIPAQTDGTCAFAADASATVTQGAFEAGDVEFEKYVEEVDGNPVAPTDDPVAISPDGATVLYHIGITVPSGAEIEEGDLTITDPFDDPAITSVRLDDYDDYLDCRITAAGVLECINNVWLDANDGEIFVDVEATIAPLPENQARRTVTNTSTFEATFVPGAIVQVQSATVSGSDSAVLLQQRGAVLRHVDIDRGSEDAAGNTGGIIWDTADDWDDTIGSQHRVCLIPALDGSPEDAAAIAAAQVLANWEISSSDATDVSAKSLQTLSDVDINGDGTLDSIYCVRWVSRGAGDQSVVLRVDDSTFIGFTGETDGTPEPLVKEWNTLDTTVIVRVANTELDNWTAAPANECVRATDVQGTNINIAQSCVNRTNLDGQTVAVNGVLDGNGNVVAPTAWFIDYTLGSHTPHFQGGVDGAKQTYSLSADSCGELVVEQTDQLGLPLGSAGPGGSVVVPSSNFGVAFGVNSTDCGVNDTANITITTTEASTTNSAPVTITETLEVTFFGPNTAKQPLLAWAGQRVILQHDWGIAPFVDGFNSTCSIFGGFIGGIGQNSLQIDQSIGILAFYELENGNGAFVKDPDLADLTTLIPGSPFNGSVLNDDTFLARLQPFPPDAPTTCVSEAIYEQEMQGQVDIKASLFTFDFDEIDPEDVDSIGDLQALIDQALNVRVYNFLVYYMEFEDVTLGIVPGQRAVHNAGDFTALNGNPFDTSDDEVDDFTANVSADVLVRARVRGWVHTSATGLDTEGAIDPETGELRAAQGGKPSGRYILPDDWEQLAGGDIAEIFRPNYDINMEPGASPYGCGSQDSCSSSGAQGVQTATSVSNAPVAGPFSLLDMGPGSGNSVAPLVGGGVYESVLPDGDVDAADAPMPPAQVTIRIAEGATDADSDAGFLKADPNSKWAVYKDNPFYATHIPADNNIPPANNYLWDSWDGDGLYPFFQGLLKNRLSPATLVNSRFLDNQELKQIEDVYQASQAGVQIGRAFTFYSDNHGEVLVWANGDFNLSYDECPVNVVGGGFHCDVDDLVGNTTISAVADYPDFKKKPPVSANTVDIDWTWDGFKTITIEPGETDQFVYVVFHARDRDGFCSLSSEQLVASVSDANGNITLEPVWQQTAATQPVLSAATGLVAPNPIPPAVDVYGNVLVPQPIPTLVNTGIPWNVTGAVSLHPVLSAVDAANTVGANDPIETIDFQIDSGDGIIVDTSAGTEGIDDILKRSATGVTTYSVEQREFEGGKVFPKIYADEDADECQAWVKLSNSLLGVTNIMATAHDDEGDIFFDQIVDFQSEFTYDLSFRWTLITWYGPDGVDPEDALRGEGEAEGGDDIFDIVTALYGWEPSSQEWLGFFPNGIGVPGANDLTALENGAAYWIAIDEPEGATWTIVTEVD